MTTRVVQRKSYDRLGSPVLTDAGALRWVLGFTQLFTSPCRGPERGCATPLGDAWRLRAPSWGENRRRSDPTSIVSAQLLRGNDPTRSFTVLAPASAGRRLTGCRATSKRIPRGVGRRRLLVGLHQALKSCRERSDSHAQVQG
jgi:hypothetical protein